MKFVIFVRITEAMTQTSDLLVDFDCDRNYLAKGEIDMRRLSLRPMTTLQKGNKITLWRFEHMVKEEPRYQANRGRLAFLSTIILIAVPISASSQQRSDQSSSTDRHRYGQMDLLNCSVWNEPLSQTTPTALASIWS